MQHNRILRTVGSALLAALVGVLTLLIYFAIILGLAVYPIQTAAVGAAIAVSIALWFHGGERRWHAWLAGRRSSTDDDEPGPETEPGDNHNQSEDAPRTQDGEDPLQAILGLDDYTELLAIGEAHPSPDH